MVPQLYLNKGPKEMVVLFPNNKFDFDSLWHIL